MAERLADAAVIKRLVACGGFACVIVLALTFLS
jgi:hypothetical protein